MFITLCSVDEEKKRELVARYTGQRTIHSSEMDNLEMDMAIRELVAMRRRILQKYLPVIGVCCTALQWVCKNDQGHNVIDFNSLNAYIEKYYHKPNLYKLSADQMVNLIVSLKSIAKRKGIRL